MMMLSFLNEANLIALKEKFSFAQLMWKPTQLLAYFFAFISITSAKSQIDDSGNLGNHTEVYVGYGVVSTHQLNEVAGVSNFTEINTPFAEIPSISTRSIGSIHIGFLRHYNDKINFGFNAAFGSYSTLWAYKDQPNISSGNTVEFFNTYITLAARFNYNWLVKDTYRFYSGFGVGSTFVSSDYTFKSFDESSLENETFARATNSFQSDIQITLIGIRAGKNLAGFAELGIGYQGFLNVGVSYRFKKPTDRF